MSELIISVSGLRGIVGETLTPDVAVRYVAAFAGKLPGGPILVGRDGRASGPMLSRAIIAALSACGRDCIDVDVAATPTIGVLVRQRGAAGAVQISASHNPPPYNGIKLFAASGRVLDAATGVLSAMPIARAKPPGFPLTNSVRFLERQIRTNRICRPSSRPSIKRRFEPDRSACCLIATTAQAVCWDEDCSRPWGAK